MHDMDRVIACEEPLIMLQKSDQESVSIQLQPQRAGVKSNELYNKMKYSLDTTIQSVHSGESDLEESSRKQTSSHSADELQTSVSKAAKPVKTMSGTSVKQTAVEEKKTSWRQEDEGLLGVGPRERLKRHRREVAGQVWIPDMWGQEDFLKDWIDCTAFDASLVPQNLMLARASLMQEGRRAANPASLRLQNSC